MRLRNIQGAREIMLESKYVIVEEQGIQNWRNIFRNNNPIYLEIGMGKGKFILEQAKKNPQINYIGIEKYSSVLVRAVEKLQSQEQKIENLIFIRMDAEHIDNMFRQGEVDYLYLNFSDPWPKDRHAKRRLTSPEYFKRYDHILSKSAKVEFKTDNKNLFDYSLQAVKEAGWIVENYTYDLHHDVNLNVGNIMTEYEERFAKKGNPICKLIAYRLK